MSSIPMERPDITKPSGGTGERLVARTQSIEEANRIAEEYEMKGFMARIAKKKEGNIALYEVWISKKPDVFSQRM